MGATKDNGKRGGKAPAKRKGTRRTAGKKGSKKANGIVLAVAIALAAGMVATALYFKSQKLANSEQVTLYLPTGSDFAAATDSLAAHGCIANTGTFKAMARLRKYDKHVKAGCYKLEPQMNMWTALTKLYYGNQDAVRITIGKHRTKETLCQYVDSRLEMSGNDLFVMLSDANTCADYGFTEASVIGMFVQNSYDIYWNTTAEKFMERMKQEYDRFWNEERKAQCKALNLTPQEVTTLASIVEEETNKNDEKPTIASVYLNRIRKGMALQADPTLKYAVGDFTLRRILNVHMEAESPYNTYKYRGLPPGPICIPSVASIDAVLANKQTNYLYFCAKADFSGYHAFAATLAEHNANAAAFHAEMNRRRIYK